MRPDPQQQPSSDRSARVIHLGEVRRRRGMRRLAPDRHYLLAIGLVAGSAWAVWLTVLLTLQPARLLTYLAFFAPLFLALAATGAIGAYAFVWNRGEFPSMVRSAERGVLFSAVVVLNLAVQAARHWTPLVAVGTVAVALALDALYGIRERRREP